MQRYTPLFSDIVHSSIWDEEDYVRIVFITMMAVQDRDHVVRHTAYAIGKMARKSEAEVLKALEVLSSPDKTRIEPQAFDGRRIEKVSDGWFLLNGEKYQQIMRQANQLEYNRKKQAEYRKKKVQNSPQFTERLNEQQTKDNQ